MSVKLFILTLLAVACLSRGGMVKSRVSSKSNTEVKSAGSLRTASRQNDDYYNEGEFDDFGDFDDSGEMEYDEPEPEPEVKSAPAPKPTTKPAPKPTTKPDMSVPKPKLHIEYTTKYPTNCPCMLSKGQNNGVCYEFTSGKKCKGRPCKPSYICIDGPAPNNAVRCMRKKNTKQVASNGDGTCKIKHVVSYGYAPYSTGR